MQLTYIKTLTTYCYNIILIIQRVSTGLCTRNSINLSAIIRHLLSGYDTHLLPAEDGANVTIELHVQGITGISELTADFELDLMYRYVYTRKHTQTHATLVKYGTTRD
jgi:hypothetical protein